MMEEKFPASFELDVRLFYDAIVKSTDDYIYIVDMKTDVALVTENMVRDFELPGRLVPGLVSLWGGLVHERDRGRYEESINQMLAWETDEHNVEYQIRTRKEEYVWVRCRGRLQRGSDGTPLMFAGVVTNLSRRGKVDHITGLFTQSECERRVETLLKDGAVPSGLMLLGLDDFTGINNWKNHIFGDAVLRQFAQDIQRLLPPGATIYRFDGDEFAIVCKRAGREEMAALYRKIHEYSNREHEADGVAYFCSASAGMALIGQDSDSYPELIKYASSAMEISKQRGKNTYTVFESALILPRLHSLEVTSQLRTSILNGMEGFYLVYQPLSKAEDMRVTGAEALLRWSGKGCGAVLPDEFIPLLESSGLIVPVGKWVLDQAARQCKAWTVYDPDFVLNVNVSYIQMLDQSFVQTVQDVLEKYDLNPSRIVLEMTESRFVTDMDTLRTSFDKLRSSQVRLAMDDFGTGYSSLGMLSQSPADIVKIDRAFISAIGDKEHSFNRAFIGAVIKLCHSVGISVCVEGVEFRDELDTVCSLKADSIQGYYISKPIPPEEFERNFWGQSIA